MEGCRAAKTLMKRKVVRESKGRKKKKNKTLCLEEEDERK
jgi:hypothetical protein